MSRTLFAIVLALAVVPAVFVHSGLASAVDAMGRGK